MREPRRSPFRIWWAIISVVVSAACVPAPDSGADAATGQTGGTPGETGGTTGGTTPGSGGAAGASALDGGVTVDGTGGTILEACVEAPTPRLDTGTVIDLPLALVAEGKPFVFGENNTLSTGDVLTPLNIRFYISEAALIGPDGHQVPVDIVGSNGLPQPYGVHFFNAEDAASTTMRVLAPPGTYAGVSFLWGLNVGCNQGAIYTRKMPLSEASQMTWPHTGYLFWRYESLVTPAGGGGVADADGGAAASDAGLAPLNAIRMGGVLGQPSAPAIRIDGSLTVPPSGPVAKTIQLNMDEIFRGAQMDIDLTGFLIPGGAEVIAGERLRRGVASLHIFSFAP
ncbi:MAG: MbnP family protein [Pseudomonadota bacterium]